MSETQQYAATFTVEDFEKDNDGNIKGTDATFFGTMNMDDLPSDQKVTAIKIFEQLKTTWSNSYANRTRRFSMHLPSKRLRSQDFDVKGGPTSHKSKKNDAQAKEKDNDETTNPNNTDDKKDNEIKSKENNKTEATEEKLTTDQ